MRYAQQQRAQEEQEEQQRRAQAVREQQRWEAGRERREWEAAAEASRGRVRAEALEKERVQREKWLDKQRTLAQPKVVANTVMMAESSFWSSIDMITHMLSFLSAKDVLACTALASKHLAELVNIGEDGFWASMLRREFPELDVRFDGFAGFDNLPARQRYSARSRARCKCVGCSKRYADSRLTMCKFCGERVCDTCPRCICMCNNCFEPCLLFDEKTRDFGAVLDDEDDYILPIAPQKCAGCKTLLCKDCIDTDWKRCTCEDYYCRSCRDHGKLWNYRACDNLTVNQTVSKVCRIFQHIRFTTLLFMINLN
jgi:hypothetical protein